MLRFISSNIKKILFLVFFCFSLPLAMLAHQPQLINKQAVITIENPEVSKAYYGELDNSTGIYNIKSTVPFNLYVNLLIPILNAEASGKPASTDLSAVIIKNDKIIKKLNGRSFSWQPYYEEFAGDNYLKGPEFKAMVEPGEYQIKVFDNDYQGKYILAVGEKEEFLLKDVFQTIKILPSLKKDFFGKSYWSSLDNKIGTYFYTFLLIIIILAITIFFYYKNKRNK